MYFINQTRIDLKMKWLLPHMQENDFKLIVQLVYLELVFFFLYYQVMFKAITESIETESQQPQVNRTPEPVQDKKVVSKTSQLLEKIIKSSTQSTSVENFSSKAEQNQSGQKEEWSYSDYYDFTLLNQHTYCLKFALEKVLPYYLKPYYYIEQKHQEAFDNQNTQLSLQQYLDEQDQNFPSIEADLYDSVLNQHRDLWRFLSWIYGAAPQIFLNDLTIILRQFVVQYQYLLRQNWNFEQLRQLILHPEFLKKVYGNKDIRFFSFSVLQAELQNGDELKKVCRLVQFLTPTMFLILNNVAEHPSYESIKEIQGKEEKVRSQRASAKSLLSRKIKKETFKGK